MFQLPLLSLVILATTGLDLARAGGHGHGHHRVIIHVPYKIKTIHHTHTITKHIHHKDDGDKYEVLGYTVGKPIDLGGHGGGGFPEIGHDFHEGHHQFAGSHDFGGNEFAGADWSAGMGGEGINHVGYESSFQAGEHAGGYGIGAEETGDSGIGQHHFSADSTFANHEEYSSH